MSRIVPPRTNPSRLLGALTPSVFLAKHWQRKPLLIRGAVPDLLALPDRDALFALAARDDVESRLIVRAADRGWSMESGPIERQPRRGRDWTLLVQGVNLYDAAADALMRRFDFVSTMRLDDLMMSYATDGGGVGPHFDSYDVFLLQIEGRRRWHWRDDRSVTARDRALVDGVPLKLLKHFVPTDEAVLEPGDMLYLPPSCAHDGVAIGECITASIGFRAPSWNALSQEFLFTMAERAWPDGRPTDAGRAPTRSPGAIDGPMLDAIVGRLSTIRWTSRDIEGFVGRHFSEPKAHVSFDPPDAMSSSAFARRAARRGLVLDLRATMLYRGANGYIVGEPFTLPRASRQAFRTLADRRRLEAPVVATLMDDAASLALLHAWWSDGWIHVREDSDGPS